MWPVAVATACAFAGSYLGKRVLRKLTLRAVQLTVAFAMLLIGAALAMGLVRAWSAMAAGAAPISS